MNYSNMIEEKNLKKTFIIATLISTVIGSFTTGLNLVDNIQAKRRQRKTDNQQDDKIKEIQKQVAESEERIKKNQMVIEQQRMGGMLPQIGEGDMRNSLATSGPMIRREYNRDMQRFGDRFAVGDSIAQTQLQGQIITLQNTVIHLLEDALYKGALSPRDVQKLYNASEFARDGTLSALHQQYQRMLQAAPIRRPGLEVRKISSTPTLKSLLPAAARDGGAGRSGLDVEIRRTEEHVDGGGTAEGRDEGIDPYGVLFCNYGLDLQEAPRMELDASFGRGGSMSCPACRVALAIEQGRAWKVNKSVLVDEIVHDDYVDEVREERMYLVANRFVVKCHRPGSQGGFACYLCAVGRDRDTICESAEGLIRHVWQKHDAREYEREVDIREVTR